MITKAIQYFSGLLIRHKCSIFTLPVLFIFLFCGFTSAVQASKLDIYNLHLQYGKIIKCFNGKKGCFTVAGAKTANSRDIQPILGYLEVDFKKGVVYAQDSTTMKIKGFRYPSGNRGGLKCAVKYAHEYIIEQFLEMDIQTNARPNCF